jgi:hypothetical protein
MMPRLIEARYAGRCYDCGAPIHVGQLIGFNYDGKAICYTCRVDMADGVVSSLTEREPVVCEKCHLTKPCDCE